ncbi:MAG: undecaprenyl-phosphate galactose phosphotransferase WbaP [Thermodesulfovibrionales bacterium]
MTARGMTRIRPAAEAGTLAAIDFLSLLAVYNTAYFLRTRVLPLLVSGLPAEPPALLRDGSWWLLMVWFFFFWYEGLYSRKFSFWDEVNALWKVSALSTAGIFVIVSLGKLGADVSRIVVVLMGCLALLVMPFFRIAGKRLFRKAGLFSRRVLILGAGTTGRLIQSALNKEPNYGYEVIGFLDDDERKVGTRVNGVKVHAGVDRAELYLRNCGIRDVFIAMPGAGKEKLQTLINRLQHEADNVFFVPDLFGVAVIGTDLHHFFHEQAFALSLRNNLSRPVNVLLKRVFDLVVSVLLLPLVACAALLLAALIKAESPGPVLYGHERVGRKGRMFRCYKFRTMHRDADAKLGRILRDDPAAKKEWEEYRKLKNDPRITRIGNFLRKTSLDELPQIMNVLKGDMSLVGPRPVTQEEIEQYYREMADLCFSVPPGISGLWQVSGRSRSDYSYRVGLDAWYVRNWNLWLDVVILFKTLRVVLLREGAY